MDNIKTNNRIAAVPDGRSAVEVPPFAVPCMHCGQPSKACPNGALDEQDNTKAVWQALSSDKRVVAIVSPAVIEGVAAYYKEDSVDTVTGKLASVLFQMGFDRVLDQRVGTAACARAEGDLFVERIKADQPLPMLLPCSSHARRFCVDFFPQLAAHLSTAVGAASLMGNIEKVVAENVFVVSIEPCTAEKTICPSGIDAVLTTREIISMMLESGFSQLSSVQPAAFTPMLGEKTMTDGDRLYDVLHAACGLVDKGEATDARIAYETQKDGKKIKAVTVFGLEEAKRILTDVQNGNHSYTIIEICSCPGGCVHGDGQPTSVNSAR